MPRACETRDEAGAAVRRARVGRLGAAWEHPTGSTPRSGARDAGRKG